MRFPHTIPKNVCEAYRCSEQTILLPREQSRSIRAEDSTWDESVIPELRILALRVLVERWKDNPILEELPTCVDRDALLEILPIDLPFELIVKRIHHECYWSRAARHRWEYNNPEDHGNSWRRLYCERHLAEYLESLEPAHFHSYPDECENLVKLVQPYLRTLSIRSLMPSDLEPKWSVGEEEVVKEEQEEGNSEQVEDRCNSTQEFVLHHIPLSVILPELTEIRELRLNFGMIYMKDGFEWRDFRFSIQDSLGLGRAIKNCPKMVKLSLTRSHLDQPRVAALLQGILFNNNIEVIDLSHCTLGDAGAHAIGEFLKNHKGLRVLSLVNNGIGAEGLAGIVHGLLQETSVPLKRLDLRLNPLRDNGGVHICALLLRNSSIEKLNISACGLGSETAVAISEVISSGYTKFSSMDIDLSNNDLGPIAGEALDAAMKTCATIFALDVRMCNLLAESECSINQSITRNLEDRRSERQALSEAHRRDTISGPGRTESLMLPSELEGLRRSQRQSNLHMEASLKSVQIQKGLPDGGTKSILKVGSRRIGLGVTDSSIQSSSTELSTASSR